MTRRILALLKGIGLDVDRIKREMGSPEITKRLAMDMEAAKTVKITGTPSFFVNGRTLERPVAKDLDAMIREEIAARYGR